jgi:hypothetical protein
VFEKTIEITTECQSCVFHNDGCDAGRLEIFQDRGLVEDKDGFPVIKGLCTLKRDNQWAEQKHFLSTYNQLYQYALDENKVRTTVVIVDNNEPYSHRHVMEKISEVLESDILPLEIIAVTDKGSLSSDSLHSAIKQVVDDSGKKVKFSTVKVYTTGKSDEEKVDLCINKKTKSMFYIVLQSSKEYIDLNQITTKINDYINRDILKFMVIKPNADRPLVVNVIAHNTFDGNNGFPIEEKLEEIAKIQERPELIMEWWNE